MIILKKPPKARNPLKINLFKIKVIVLFCCYTLGRWTKYETSAILYIAQESYLSQCMRFPTMWYLRPAKPQISLHIMHIHQENMVLSKYRILLHIALIMFGVYDSESTISDVLLLLMFYGSSSRCHGLVCNE